MMPHNDLLVSLANSMDIMIETQGHEDLCTRSGLGGAMI
jgi:hypothetical protein